MVRNAGNSLSDMCSGFGSQRSVGPKRQGAMDGPYCTPNPLDVRSHSTILYHGNGMSQQCNVCSVWDPYS